MVACEFSALKCSIVVASKELFCDFAKIGHACEMESFLCVSLSC